ncbi:hypothetical protein C0991_009891, partial [Blastosporella zonata]
EEFGRFLNGLWKCQSNPDVVTNPVNGHTLDKGLIDNTNLDDNDLELFSVPEPAAPSPLSPPLSPRCTYVEDARNDEEEHRERDGDADKEFVEACPSEWKAGATWGTNIPEFEKIHREQEAGRQTQWGPFKDEEEWQLAEWLIQNVGQTQTDEFLKLPIV